MVHGVVPLRWKRNEQPIREEEKREVKDIDESIGLHLTTEISCDTGNDVIIMTSL